VPGEKFCLGDEIALFWERLRSAQCGRDQNRERIYIAHIC
jgi:hypothetical protein